MVYTNPPDPLHVPPPVQTPAQRARPPMTRAQVVGAIVAVVLSSAVGVGAAFGFDVCAALASSGVQVAACQAAPPR
jgi:C4-dicarboxylate transporter